MLTFLKKYALDLILVTLMVLTLLIVEGTLPQSAEAFDYLATIGWTCVPFALCWLLLRVSYALKVCADSKAVLESAQAELAVSQSWAVRHETKAFRRSHSA